MTYLKTTISSSTNKQLRQFINDNHEGFKKGLLSETVEKALLFYIQHAHTYPENKKNLESPTKQKFPTFSKSASKYDRLVDSLKHYAAKDTGKIDIGMVKRLIQKHIGRDNRTVEKYLVQLEHDAILVKNEKMESFIDGWTYDTALESQKEELEIVRNTRRI